MKNRLTFLHGLAIAALVSTTHARARSGQADNASTRLLRRLPWLLAGASEPGEPATIDAGLRAYTRSFAAPLIPVAAAAAMLMLAAWLAELA